MTTRIFFDPWVGPDYGKPRSSTTKKLLVLGDSHYGDEDECPDCKVCGDRDEAQDRCTEFTTQVIKDYLNPERSARWKKTISTIVNSVYRQQTTLSIREAFCNSIAFYNFLQVVAGVAPRQTGDQNYKAPRHLEAFYEVLKQVSPEVVISWGDAVWDALPDDWGYGDAVKGKEIHCGTATFRSWQIYPFQNAHITLIGVHHPCAGYDRDFHDHVLNQFEILKPSV